MIINSDHVSVYYIEKIETCYDYDPERQKPYCIAADNGLKRIILGYYEDCQEAGKILHSLLYTLQSEQSGWSAFHMPQA